MMRPFPSRRVSTIFSIPTPNDSEYLSGLGLSLPHSQSSGEQIIYLKHSFVKKMNKCLWKRWLLGILPVVSLTVTVVLLVMHYTLAPAFSFIYVGGSVEIPNLTFTSDLTHPRSHRFTLQAEVLQNYFAELYGSSVLGTYYLKSVISAFSEGKTGLRAYYWSTFWAPKDIVITVKNVISVKQKQIISKRRPPKINGSSETDSLEEDFDIITMELFVSDYMDYDVTLKSAELQLKSVDLERCYSP
ncbi:suppressor of tumorigenicity 14 protein homolog [Sphaerodactylus townsendi]|uniref:suppressor of tumorigenicity 14 protein homolog n=1 Tax=Sphaerodactylus townsendi TaxID=933632 RepID=UPI0020270107|nr:suppressor of tumorigenicity 14 protein homolog [Sphaerodactylus townsendi]